MGHKEFQVSQAKKLFDPEESLKRLEDDIKERLQKQRDDTK
jgi:hypothetical protein